MRLACIVALLSALISPPALAAGFATSQNFVVFTPSTPGNDAGQNLAERVLRSAEGFRAQVAREWFDEELPAGAGRTVINVVLSDAEDYGLTWAIDHPARRFHNVYLTTSAELAVGATLHHEIAHSVLATHFPHPHRLAVWLEEGIASRYDDPATLAARLRIVRSWGRQGPMPQLRVLFAAPKLTAQDDQSYAMAASLVSFLLTRGDRQTLLDFGADGRSLGWDAALRAHYRIAGVDRLQAEWESWLRTATTTASTKRARAASRI